MAPSREDTRSNAAQDGTGAPSAFSTYASRFLNGNAPKPTAVEGSQIFRAPSPSSPSHDPFLPSPSTSHSHPHLHGGSRSPSPTRTPPFPGPGIDSLRDIDDSHNDAPGVEGSGLGIGLLFGSQAPAASVSASRSNTAATAKGKGKGRALRSSIPNPYAPSSSSESDAELEPDLEEVDTIRRSLLRPTPKPKSKGPVSGRAKKGWLAHQSIFPPSSSSGSSETDESDKQTEPDTDDENAGMMGRSRNDRSRSRSKSRNQTIKEEDEDEDGIDGYILSPSELHQANNAHTERDRDDLGAPLLGPDDLDRTRGGGGGKVPVRLQVYHGRFGHWEREGLRKYKDSGFLALWLTSIMGVLLGLLFVWGSTDPPADSPQKTTPSLIPLLPLLLVLLIPSLVLPAAFLFLLQKTVRPVLLATAISIPFSLFVCGWWAIGASFDTSGLNGVDSSDRWWGTTGLRICAVLLWLLAAWFGRLVWLRRKRLERTVSVVELSTHLLLSHPPLLLLSPLLLAIFAVTSLPFLTMVVRLGMIGYWRHPRENTWVFHLRPYAGWLIALVSLAWLWTWGVVRGVGKVTVAAVIGEWYFHREEERRQDTLEVTTAALHRATGTSLGSICLGSLIVAIVRMAGRSAAELKRVTSPRSNILPTPLMFLSKLTPAFAIVAGLLDQLNGYALVYVGITGDAFWPSARRAVGLAGRRKGGHLLDYTLIKLLLTLSSTAMGLFTATAGYLYMTHSLSNPGYAPWAALLCGAVPFLAIRAGAAVLGDAADSLFICFQIDRELGGGHCEEAKKAFEGEVVRGANAA